jgi:hypothetical protein
MNPGSRKTLGVTFDMADPLERELYQFVERRTRHFSDLVKHLLFAWRHGYLNPEPPRERRTEKTDGRQEIRKSGLPFG